MGNRICSKAIVVTVAIALSLIIAGCSEVESPFLDQAIQPSATFSTSKESQIPECAEPTFIITPIQALQDEEVHIKLCGLTPHEIVEIEARMQLEANAYWESAATFIADADGQVDIDSQAPVDGSYESVDPMGLVWSMTRQRAPLMPSEWVWPEPAIIELTAHSQDKAIASANIERQFVKSGVERIPVRDQGFVGTFYVPSGENQLPAIIVLSGSIDDLSERTAAMLASHGYASLTLWYMRGAESPGGLENVPLEYFESAIKWISRHPRIDGNRLAVMGGSRGGELALLLAATYPDIKLVVAYAPSGVVWQGLTLETLDSPSWILNGTPVPYARFEWGNDFDKYVNNQLANSEPIAYAPLYLASIKSDPSIEKAMIHVERIGGPILLISGEEDRMWPSTFFADMVIDRLKQHAFPYTFSHLSYSDAGHFIIPPYWPTTEIEYRQPSTGWRITLGGNPPGNAKASLESWDSVIIFLKEYLRG